MQLQRASLTRQKLPESAGVGGGARVGKTPRGAGKDSCYNIACMTTQNSSLLGMPASDPAPSAANPPQRILVVDDDRDIRRLNTEVLRHSGYLVDAAEDGAVAWDALQLNNYDLLVTDNTMPKMSGLDLLKKIHAARLVLPTILVTGEPPTQELHLQPWLQIEAMLLKPYTFDEFLATVNNVLHATGHALEHLAPPPNPSSRSAPNRLQR